MAGMLPQVPDVRLLDPSQPDRVRSVLLVRLRVGLGDLLCTVPGLRALRAAHPELHVGLATWPEMSGVLARYPSYVDELVPFPGVTGIPERAPDGSYDQWCDRMRARSWDLALQVYGDNPVANAVTADVGARVTGGFAPTRGPGLDRALHLPYPHALHEADRHLRLLEHLGLPSGGSRALEWPVLPEDACDVPSGDYVVLHPGATCSSRRWPVERFAAVGDALAADGLTVALGGVRSEAATTAAVIAAMRAPAVDLTGRTSLGQYAVLLRDAAVVVANDTGTAHLTAAVGGRVVTVFLSGDPVRWRHAPQLQTVVQQQVGCNPCPHLDCPIDFRCAWRIRPERVVQAAREMLARRPTPSAAP